MSAQNRRTTKIWAGVCHFLSPRTRQSSNVDFHAVPIPAMTAIPHHHQHYQHVVLRQSLIACPPPRGGVCDSLIYRGYSASRPFVETAVVSSTDAGFAVSLAFLIHRSHFPTPSFNAGLPSCRPLGFTITIPQIPFPNTGREKVPANILQAR